MPVMNRMLVLLPNGSDTSSPVLRSVRVTIPLSVAKPTEPLKLVMVDGSASRLVGEAKPETWYGEVVGIGTGANDHCRGVGLVLPAAALVKAAAPTRVVPRPKP